MKSNKNDYVDAEAIAEAVQRPTTRFVPIKTEDQLDLQALHRVRDRLITRRTGVINQLRAFLLDRGLTFRPGRVYLLRHMPLILAEAEAKLSPRMVEILHFLWKNGEAWKHISRDYEMRSTPWLSKMQVVGDFLMFPVSVPS